MLLSPFERRIIRIQKILDLLTVALVWAGTYFLRIHVFSDQRDLVPLFLGTGFVLAFFTLWFFSREKLYKSHRLTRRMDLLLKLLKANLWTVTCFIVFLYFCVDHRVSRGVILAYALVSTVVFASVRILLHRWLDNHRRRKADPLPILLVGSSPSIETYVRTMQGRPESGVVFSAWLDSKGAADRLGIPEFDGTIREAKSRFRPQRMVVSYPAEENHRLPLLIAESYNDVVPLVILPALPYSVLGLSFEDGMGIPALHLNQPDFSPVALFIKRLIDIGIAGVGALVLSPFLLLIALGVKLTSRGPVLFSQERVGFDGETFRMWKFRSMKVDAESRGTWTRENDDRKTPFGSFLRATSLDELPQLWNILVGEMSVVGPRPEQPFYVEKFRAEIPAYMLRHKMKVGLTGWAQINGWRGDTDLVKRVEFDLFYIRTWSLWFDLKIIFLTFFRGFVNKNAY